MEKPFIKGFSEQKGPNEFTVSIHASSFDDALEFARNYFSLLSVVYDCSDFDGNHEFKISPRR